MKMRNLVSKKCEYALRAVCEPARHAEAGPMKIQDIASTQGTPFRFLEIILVELKSGSSVLSKRGQQQVRRCIELRDLTVGEVFFSYIHSMPIGIQAQGFKEWKHIREAFLRP